MDDHRSQRAFYNALTLKYVLLPAMLRSSEGREASSSAQPAGQRKAAAARLVILRWCSPGGRADSRLAAIAPAKSRRASAIGGTGFAILRIARTAGNAISQIRGFGRIGRDPLSASSPVTHPIFRSGRSDHVPGRFRIDLID